MAQLDNIQAAIQAFSGYKTLKKLALMVVAYKSTSDEIGFLKKTFGIMDTTNDGEISLNEFKAGLSQNYQYSDQELEAMFSGIDLDGSGTVHYIEWLASTIEAHGQCTLLRFELKGLAQHCYSILILLFLRYLQWMKKGWPKLLIDSIRTIPALSL